MSNENLPPDSAPDERGEGAIPGDHEIGPDGGPSPLPPATSLPPAGSSPPGAARKSRRRLIIAIAGGLAVVIVVVVVALAVLGSGPTVYGIRTPATAGGWPIAAPGSIPLTGADLHGLQKISGGNLTAGRSALYTDPANHVQIDFLGASGALGDPARLLKKLRLTQPVIASRLGITMTWTRVNPGPHGGAAACGQGTSTTVLYTVRIAICAWQTTTSFGELVAYPRTKAALNAKGPFVSEQTLAAEMRLMRPDLEVAK